MERNSKNNKVVHVKLDTVKMFEVGFYHDTLE